MYQWDKQRQSLDLPISAVLRLERAIAEVQVTLPGLAPEPARAYLCAWQQQGGIRIAVVLDLKTSRRHACYLNGDGEIEAEDAGRVLAEGRQFAESLGFTLSDLDLRRRSPAEQQALWNELRFLQPAGAQPAASEIKPRPAVTGAGSAEPEVGPQLPSPEEMLRHRRQFIDNLGRLLAML